MVRPIEVSNLDYHRFTMVHAWQPKLPSSFATELSLLGEWQSLGATEISARYSLRELAECHVKLTYVYGCISIIQSFDTRTLEILVLPNI